RPAADRPEPPPRPRVALRCRRGALRAGDSLRAPPGELQQPHRRPRRTPGELAGLSHQGTAARVLLPAATVATPAQPAVGYHPVVPRLPGHAPLAPVEPAVQDDAGPDAGADRDEDAMRMPPRRAEPRLGPGAGVRVVVHHDRQPDDFLDPQAQWLLAPRQVRREPHARARLVDEPGRSQADGPHLVTAQQLADNLDDHLFRARRA